MCPNEMAKHLYEKNGFIVEGVKKKSMIVDGTYVDEYYMAKIRQIMSSKISELALKNALEDDTFHNFVCAVSFYIVPQP